MKKEDKLALREFNRTHPWPLIMIALSFVLLIVSFVLGGVKGTPVWFVAGMALFLVLITVAAVQRGKQMKQFRMKHGKNQQLADSISAGMERARAYKKESGDK